MRSLHTVAKGGLAIFGILRDREGQSLVEYSIILMLVALVAVGTVTLFGGAVNNLYTQIVGSF